MTAAPRHLLIVGDSIALGVTEIVSDEIRGRAGRSFVDRLRPRLAGWRIDVDAAVHRTSERAVRLLPALLQRHRPEVVLFVLGGSDADINWKRFILTGGRRVRPNTPVDRFELNLRQMTDAVHAVGAGVILSDLPSHDLAERGRRMAAVTGRDIFAMLDVAGGQTTSDRLHAQYLGVIERVARDTGTPVARWAERLKMLPFAQRCGPDAIHPSDAAHALIADVIADVLEPETSAALPPALAAVRS